MKRQRVLSFFSLRQLWETPHFVFLTVMLLCGALAGSFTGLRSGQYEGALLEQLAGQMTAQLQDTSWGFAVRALLTRSLPSTTPIACHATAPSNARTANPHEVS